jgi:general secretion pathway protein C
LRETFSDNLLMQTSPTEIWSLRLSSFALAALAAASVAYWALKWVGAAPLEVGSAMAAPAQISIDATSVARVLGAVQTAAAVPSAAVSNLASQFKLTGVVAQRSGGGYALIATEGKPAQSYRVGSRVSETLVLHSVTARSASLAAKLDGPVTVTLELPPIEPQP